MTDRYATLTVVLDRDIRDDDAEPLIKAIGMMKGVIAVEGNVDNLHTYAARERLRREWGQKLYDFIQELLKD
jgi:hypothetical protein